MCVSIKGGVLATPITEINWSLHIWRTLVIGHLPIIILHSFSRGLEFQNLPFEYKQLHFKHTFSLHLYFIFIKIK